MRSPLVLGVLFLTRSQSFVVARFGTHLESVSRKSSFDAEVCFLAVDIAAQAHRKLSPKND